MSAAAELDPSEGPRRRVAFVVTRSDTVGGVQVCIELLAGGLMAAGHEVRVYVGGEGPFVDRLARAGVPCEPQPDLLREIDPRRDLRGLLALRRNLARFAPQLVSTHSTKAGWLGRAAARSLGVATVHTVHGWVFGWQPPLKAAIGRALETATAPLADAIVAVSASDRRRGVELRIAPARKFHLVHNGVPDLPQRAEPGRGPAKLVSVSRLQAPKDPLTLIAALAQLHARAPGLDWRLEWIGDGPLEQAVRDAVTAAGLEARIDLLGSRDDVPARLAAAQLFVLSSTHEGFPVSVIEAMRAGLPVVSSDVGGIAEAVTSGVSGELVPAGSPQALAGALEPLIADSSLRARYGAAGRAAYLRDFSFERCLRRTWAVYDAAIARRAG